MNPEMNPQQSASILSRMFGYQGPANQGAIDQFLAANPAAAARMGKYQEAMQQMVSGRNIAGMQTGGVVDPKSPIAGVDSKTAKNFENLQQNIADAQKAFEAAQKAFDKADPKKKAEYEKLRQARNAARGKFNRLSEQMGTTLQQAQQRQVFQAGQPLQQAAVADVATTPGQLVDKAAGQLQGAAPTATAGGVQNVEAAQAASATPAAQMTATSAKTDVAAATAGVQGATGAVTPQALISAAQETTSSVSNIQAEQGTAILMNNPVQRAIENGELITGAADAATASQFTEQIQAATATPTKKATVAGQLEELMDDFVGGNTPTWAAGAIRAANQALVARGLGASSVAGQAVIQAAMEAALPIAQADAATQAQFEAQNLSNRQQRAILAAQQRAAFIGQEFDQEFQARVANSARIGEIANLNFTAEQQIALENARVANTANLQNLSNKQAVVMAEAAALSQLDISNLSNRQQAAVQNAQNFLSMDMANLNNEQQALMFKAQQNVQAIFTDQAAENAAAQFNATSENQTNQFFANLKTQTSQFNASQVNAIRQFNVNEENAMNQFNAEMQNQRQVFNANNALVVAQANAQWRQNVATLEFSAQNEANMQFAKAQNALSAAALDQIWQRERDIMSYAFTASESQLDRDLQIMLADKNLKAYRDKMQSDEEAAKAGFWLKLISDWN